MDMDMQPQVGDSSITIPVTFDYRGGRSSKRKSKIILAIAVVVVGIILTVGFFTRDGLVLWQRFTYSLAAFYVALLILRFFVLGELKFSDIYEGLKARDFNLNTEDIWQIYDIDYVYPYTFYFKNGQKGIFVRMERDTITGKSEDADFYHYEAIGNAYNRAHALNMDIIHIDYMDNVGNDARMEGMYQELNDIENPDMQEMMLDIYSNLQEEMSRNYYSFDIYLFLTRDSYDTFVKNIHSVANLMLGGNFISYKVLNKREVSGVCTALFNLHDFNVLQACENVLQGAIHTGIRPIKVIKADGTVIKLNNTIEEQKVIDRQNAELERQKKEEKKKNRFKKPKETVKKKPKEESKKKPIEKTNENVKTNEQDDLNLF